MSNVIKIVTHAPHLGPKPKPIPVEESNVIHDTSLPSKIDMAKNLLESLGEIVKNGAGQRTPDEIEKALEICKVCPHFIIDKIRCSRCGCRMDVKIRLASLHCPIGKW